MNLLIPDCLLMSEIEPIALVGRSQGGAEQLECHLENNCDEDDKNQKLRFPLLYPSYPTQ